MASSPIPYLPTASKERFSVDGPSSPMPRAKIPRKRQSSVFGQWVPCRMIAFKESLTGVPRRTVMISPRKSALEKATTEGGYSSAPMKLFKDLTLQTGRSEPRVPPEVYKAVSDTIQACQLGGADPKQAAEKGSQRIESFLSGYTGAPLL